MLIIFRNNSYEYVKYIDNGYSYFKSNYFDLVEESFLYFYLKNDRQKLVSEFTFRLNNSLIHKKYKYDAIDYLEDYNKLIINQNMGHYICL